MIKIKELRKKMGLSQAELAKRINVTAQVISNWERNYTTPDIEDIQRLAKTFDVATDYLLDLEKENSHPNKLDGDKLYVLDTSDSQIKVMYDQLDPTEQQWLLNTLLLMQKRK